MRGSRKGGAGGRAYVVVVFIGRLMVVKLCLDVFRLLQIPGLLLRERGEAGRVIPSLRDVLKLWVTGQVYTLKERGIQRS